MSNELSLRPDQQLSIGELVSQVALVQEVMTKVMKEKEHYGIIPGCGEKPTLLKSGAEKLAFVFRLCPEFQIEEKNLPRDHKEYRVVCTMKGRDGTFLGQGVGVASTMETKWRFRKGKSDSIPTGRAVPKDYWDAKNSGNLSEAQRIIGGKGFGTKKIDGSWEIVELCAGEREEHDNPADYFNTCLKMAKKRAQVDATLTCTAASDIFTQDVEELKENGVIASDEPKQANATTRDATPTSSTRQNGENGDRDYTVRDNAKPVFDDSIAISGRLVGIKNSTGKTKAGKDWTRFDVSLETNGETIVFKTFDSALVESAPDLVGKEVDIQYIEKNNGRYTDFQLVALKEKDEIPF